MHPDVLNRIKKVGKCWIWTGELERGYGRFLHNKKHIKAHRYFYKVFIGEIPPGLQIDHLCKNTKCVNPKHLEAVTQKENIKRQHEKKINMELIKIHYNPSAPVTNWNNIKDIAEEMNEIVNKRQHCLAMHHAYVTQKPLNFFVLNEEALKDFIPKLGSKYIINPKIEAFVKASVLAMPEACVAFPHRSPKNVMRAFVLKVSYQIPDPLSKNGLKKVENAEVERIIAQIFQHEIDHANGKNIFFDAPKAIK